MINDDQWLIVWIYVAIPWLITVYWFEKEEADFAPPRFKFGDRAMKRPHVHIEIQSSSHHRPCGGGNPIKHNKT